MANANDDNISLIGEDAACVPEDGGGSDDFRCFRNCHLDLAVEAASAAADSVAACAKEIKCPLLMLHTPPVDLRGGMC